MVLASQPYRLRVSPEVKSRNVLLPLVRSLGPGGRLIGIHSSGQDPAHEILKKIWPNDNPFASDRHMLLKAVKNELGSDSRYYNIKSNSDNRSIFKYDMHSLPSELEASIGTSTLFAAWNAASVVFIALFAPRIAVGRSKKKIAVGIFLTSIVVGPLPMVLRLLEPIIGIQLFPVNGSDLIWWILLIHSCALVSIGSLGFIFITSMAMEIVEDVERTTGRREEGLLGTVSSMIQKLIGAGGVLIAGLILAWAGFDDPGITEEMKSGALIDRFATIHIAIGFFLPIISTLLILKYDIDRKGHLDNVNDLGYVEKN